MDNEKIKGGRNFIQAQQTSIILYASRRQFCVSTIDSFYYHYYYYWQTDISELFITTDTILATPQKNK